MDHNHTILPYSKSLKDYARFLRRNATLAEVLLWKRLKQKQVCNCDFDRQRPIGAYIVDFYCKEMNLAIEIDGKSHDDKLEADILRQQKLESIGVSFLRFWDHDVKTDLGRVVATVEEWIAQKRRKCEEPTPGPSKEGISDVHAARPTLGCSPRKSLIPSLEGVGVGSATAMSPPSPSSSPAFSLFLSPSLSSRSGMTLLELLIAVTLVAVAALVVAQAFAAGLRVWSRASQLSGHYADSTLAMEGLQKDIRNMVPSRLATIRGGAAWVEIPSLISSTDNAGLATVEPGLIRYDFDVAGKRLDRVASPFDIIASGLVRRETVAAGLAEVSFRYAESGGANGGLLIWGRTWEARTNNPVAVKVVWSGQQGEDIFEFERTVTLPGR